jgi:hypothetical protein
LLEHQADFRGAVFSAPAVVVDRSVSAATVAAGKALALVAPRSGFWGWTSTASARPGCGACCLGRPTQLPGKDDGSAGCRTVERDTAAGARLARFVCLCLCCRAPTTVWYDPAGAESLRQGQLAGQNDPDLTRGSTTNFLTSPSMPR